MLLAISLCTLLTVVVAFISDNTFSSYLGIFTVIFELVILIFYLKKSELREKRGNIMPLIGFICCLLILFSTSIERPFNDFFESNLLLVGCFLLLISLQYVKWKYRIK